ncbi:MAG: S-layer homology domain-containing protein [Candidatus Riflebacteria bacterium]|nr:S-layer homology domain-containing protein [Candidatus Riflebacteria bacterium]MBF0500506.1 S-layer homology domain-containing protein [Candidatus Riflebacteria bacterium]
MMNERTRYFLIGTLAAGVMTATSFDLRGLEAVSERITEARMAPELRLGVDIGILDASDIRFGLVDVAIVRRDFGRVLKQTLQMLGAPAGSELSDLESTGIFELGNPRKSISRKQALETLCRAVIHLADSGFINLPAPCDTGFKDYAPPPKYQAALAFLRSKGVARGYQSGYFGIEKNLTKREAVYLLYRLYEQTAADMMSRTKKTDFFFVDIPTDHPVMASIKTVYDAGGFERIPLKASFDGNRPLLRRDAVLLMKGILAKRAHNTGDVSIEVQDPFEALNRAEFAVLIEGLLAKTENLASSTEFTPATYVDVAAGSPESRALEALSKRGIQLGYGNGYLRGDESVTWFEAVGVLASVASVCGDTTKVDESGDPAGHDDFEKYAEMLRSKKARIRSILDRNRVHQRK